MQSLFPWFCRVNGSYRKHDDAKDKILKVQTDRRVPLKQAAIPWDARNYDPQ